MILIDEIPERLTRLRADELNKHEARPTLVGNHKIQTRRNSHGRRRAMSVSSMFASWLSSRSKCRSLARMLLRPFL